MWMFDTNTEGVSVTNNILSVDPQWQGLAQDGGVPQNTCSGLLGKALADCKFTPNYVWANNFMIGNHASRFEVVGYWPKLKNYFPHSQDLGSIGWVNYQPPAHALGNPQNTDYHLQANEHDLGADIDAMEAAQGKVKSLGVPAEKVTQTSAAIAFVAPDRAGCPVDYSTDPAVMTNFKRVADPGGARERSVLLPDLSSGTVYYYRVNCAAEQPTGSFRTH
jgi:hypothetical protein